MDTSKITDVLIFKEGYYWLTTQIIDQSDGVDDVYGYAIIPEDSGIANGFEFASDAYAYLAHIQKESAN